MVESLSEISSILYSEEEYFLQAEESVEKLEFYDGKITKMAGATTNHNLISSNIITLLNIELWQKDESYFVLNSDQRIAIPKLNAYVYPDAVVVCETLKYYEDRKDTIVNPILVVEVVSNATAETDRTIKFEKYRTLASFKEYVLIEQTHPQILSRFRSEPNTWIENEVTNIEGEIILPSLDVQLSLKKVYRGVEFDK